jgi:3-carboxy-cis,cis-muconate cycloisomerase
LRSDAAAQDGPAAPAGLFDHVLARGAVRSTIDDDAWLRALLRVEAALALATAKVGLIPAEAASAIAALCATVRPGVADLAAAAAASGNPVVPLVVALRAAAPPEVADYVHKGATSQDIMDTAAMLVARDALGVILDDLHGAVAAAADLAQRHRDTVMAGRTLLKQAVPTTFGLKAAGWMLGLEQAAARVDVVRTGLPIQLGGAAGTRSRLGGRGEDVARELAHELGLGNPILPWHAIRVPIADLAMALGCAAGVIGKVARDITLLSQDEVAEVSESNPGGSSAMAHKRNPVAAVCALAGASQAPGLVATLLTAMVQEHERAAGAWHAEWRPLRELMVTTGSAASWLRACLTDLIVFPDAMRAHLMTLQHTLGTEAGYVDVGEAPHLVDAAIRHREETG